MRFFTADTHYGDPNIIELRARPFVDLKEMRETLIERWNKVVGRHDFVYHVGNFGWYGLKVPDIEQILSRLNGFKFLIVGGGDDLSIKKARGWAGVCQTVTGVLDKKGVSARLVHNPAHLYVREHRGNCRVIIHGRTHGAAFELLPGIFYYDVGVDGHEFTPVSEEQVEQVVREASETA